MPSYLLSVTCPDTVGIIHAFSGALLGIGANVLEQEQFSDTGTGLFFARTRFECDESDVAVVRAAVDEQTGRFDASVVLRPEDVRRRALIAVSQYDHCLRDLLYRWQAGELPLDIVGVVSNHDVCRPIADRYGLPFHLLPVTPDTKPEQEARLLDLVRDERVDLLVLARYMQILSDDVCRAMPGRIINIHHSFLPGFKGARPYHQAHARGVKLIGATAHYVTTDLDEGPIIEQGIERVDHTFSPAQLTHLGSDVESMVLNRAVQWHAERRVFRNGPKTVVLR